MRQSSAGPGRAKSTSNPVQRLPLRNLGNKKPLYLQRSEQLVKIVRNVASKVGLDKAGKLVGAQGLRRTRKHPQNSATPLAPASLELRLPCVGLTPPVGIGQQAGQGGTVVHEGVIPEPRVLPV